MEPRRNGSTVRRRTAWWNLALIVPLLPLIVVFVAATLLLFVLSTACLHIAIWTWWCLRGRDILFVYSDSPTWREYIELNILPALGDRAIVLNWSARKRWRFSLARLAFYHFGGYRQFNPLAVTFRPLRRTQTFRFWEPFREFKHGRPNALHALEQQFFKAAGIQNRRPA